MLLLLRLCMSLMIIVIIVLLKRGGERNNLPGLFIRYLPAKGSQGHLMLLSCLQSQGSHRISLFQSPLRFFCLVVLFLFLSCHEILQLFSLREGCFCVALVEWLGDDSCLVVCAACCHMALVFVFMHFNSLKKIYILCPFLFFLLFSSPPPPPHTHTHTLFSFFFLCSPPPPPPPHILFFSLVSVSYIEWSTIPACPSPICFLTWAVLNLKVWTLWYWCMYVLFYICVGIEFWIWLSVTLEVSERKDLHIIVWEQFWSLSLVLTGLDCPLLWPCVVDRTFRSQNPPPPPFF